MFLLYLSYLLYAQFAASYALEDRNYANMFHFYNMDQEFILAYVCIRMFSMCHVSTSS